MQGPAHTQGCSRVRGSPGALLWPSPRAEHGGQGPPEREAEEREGRSGPPCPHAAGTPSTGALPSVMLSVFAFSKPGAEFLHVGAGSLPGQPCWQLAQQGGGQREWTSTRSGHFAKNMTTPKWPKARGSRAAVCPLWLAFRAGSRLLIQATLALTLGLWPVWGLPKCSSQVLKGKLWSSVATSQSQWTVGWPW